MRRVEPAETIDPRQQIGSHALHHPTRLAMDIGVQATEIRDAGCGSHAAEKTIPLDQQRATPGARGSHRRRDARRPAAKDRDFIFAVERDFAGGLGDGFAGQGMAFRIVEGQPGRIVLKRCR